MVVLYVMMIWNVSSVAYMKPFYCLLSVKNNIICLIFEDMVLMISVFLLSSSPPFPVQVVLLVVVLVSNLET